MNLRSLAVLGSLWVGACNGGHTESSEQAPVELPEGAIAVGDDLYMVPLAAPVAGCPAFRAFSPTKMVVQAIYFRTADGRFVTDRQEADCN